MAKKPATTKKSPKPKELKNSSSLSKSLLLIFTVAFAVVGGYFLLHSFAAPTPPTVYLSVSSNVNGPNTSFTVQVRENSGTTTVNAIQANLSYPSSLLTLSSVDYTGSAFATQAQSTLGTGTVAMARGVSCSTTCPTVSGDQLVATLNFKTNATGGSASVAFTTGTQLISSSTNQDILGGLTATAGGTYVIDTTAPTVSISAPANNSTQSAGSNVSVTATTSDTQSAITKVEIYIDSVLAGTVTTSPYTYTWNTSSAALGSHTLSAKSYDSSGNIGTSAAVTVSLADQTAPSAPSSFRSTGSTINSITLAWNASTDNVGVTGYKITRGGTLIATVTPPTLTYTDSGLTANTAYSYAITAVDAANNASSATTLSTSTAAVTPGDINLDGHVNSSDLTIILANYGTSYAPADINKNGTVDISDFSTVLSHFGS